MKLYGSNRYSTMNCKYGCCGLKEARGAKQTANGKAARKIAKHRARQQARIVVGACAEDDGTGLVPRGCAVRVVPKEFP